MAGDLEKFVLQYVVNAGSANKDLDALNKRIEKTNKAGDDGQKSMGGFAKGLRDASGEVKGLSGSVGSLLGGLGRVSPALMSIAGAALTVGAALRAANQSMKELNAQAETAFKAGTSTTQVEAFQRAAVRASGGRLSREQARGLIEKQEGIGRAAYMDTTQNNQQAKALREAGVNINDQMGQITSPMDQLMQVSQALAQVDATRAQQLGIQLGYTQQEITALRELGAQQANLMKMTQAQADIHSSATEAAVKLAGAQERIKTAFGEMSDQFGERLLPGLSEFVDWLAKVSEGTRDAAKGMLELMDRVNSFLDGLFGLNGKKAGLDNAKESYSQKQQEQQKEMTKEQKKALEQQNKQAYQNAVQWERNTQNFAAAVQQFTGAVDERQAMAAWAGGIGAGAGLTGPASIGGKATTGTPGTASFNAAAVAAATGGGAAKVTPIAGGEMYNNFINEAAKTHGVDPNLIRRVMRVESKFNPNAVSPVGAQGLMQVMPSNHKALGITNGFDPKQSIMGGAQLLAEYLKAANGDVPTALMMYHGGYKRENWGKLTQAYPGKVLGTNGTTYSDPVADALNPNAAPTYTFAGGINVGAGGESKAKVQRNMVMQAIAGRIGVPVGQLAQGGVNRGDVSWAASQIYTEAQNSLLSQQQSLNAPGLTPQKRLAIQNGIFNTQQNMANLRNYSPGIEGGSREGGREKTIGDLRVAPVINLTVNGGISTPITLMDVRREIQGGVRDGLNDVHSGNKI